MRKLILGLALLLTGVVGAQDRIGEFDKDGKVLYDKETDNLYFILENNVGIDFEDKTKKQEFVDMISTSYTKGKKWAKIARENSTKDFRKELDKMAVDGMFRSSKWFFGGTVVKTMFLWEKGEATMYIYLHTIEAKSNEYIKSEPALIWLTSTNVLDIEKMLSQEYIDEYYAKKDKHENLFQ